MPYWLAVAVRGYDSTGELDAAGAFPVPVVVSNLLAVGWAMGTAVGHLHLVRPVEGDDHLRHRLRVPAGAADLGASYYGSGYPAGTVAVEPSAAAGVAAGSAAEAVEDSAADFAAAAVAVVALSGFEVPTLSLHIPYGVADLLVVESVSNYLNRQYSKGFSAVDHWDPACAIGAGCSSCRLLPIVDSKPALLGTAGR